MFFFFKLQNLSFSTMFDVLETLLVFLCIRVENVTLKKKKEKQNPCQSQR